MPGTPGSIERAGVEGRGGGDRQSNLGSVPWALSRLMGTRGINVTRGVFVSENVSKGWMGCATSIPIAYFLVTLGVYLQYIPAGYLGLLPGHFNPIHRRNYHGASGPPPLCLLAVSPSIIHAPTPHAWRPASSGTSIWISTSTSTSTGAGTSESDRLSRTRIVLGLGRDSHPSPKSRTLNPRTHATAPTASQSCCRHLSSNLSPPYSDRREPLPCRNKSPPVPTLRP